MPPGAWALEGAELTLRCEAQRGSFPILYEFFHEDALLKKVETTFWRAVSFRLSLTAEHSGNYHCTANNDFGHQRSEAVTLSVIAGQAGGWPVMGPCSEDPHLRWASWLLGLAELAGVLLGVCGTGRLSSGGADSRAHVSLKRVRGGSVLLHVTRELEGDTEAQLEEMAWGFGPETTYRVLLRVGSGGDLPTWVSLQDKYRHRVRVPNMRSLLIANLTHEDSGQYRARGSFTGGREFTQVFQLTVYEPVPLPQILAKSLSVTADWCNVTLECRAMGASEDLNVTWWHSDLPRKWQQTGTLAPGLSIWHLAVRLPLDQAYTSLSCNTSNEVDLKTATTTLGDVCANHPQGQATGHHRLGLAGVVMAVLLTVGVGLYLWKTCGKKKEEMEMGTGRLRFPFRPDQRGQDRQTD